MSALGLGVLFVISFTLGIAWLVWVLDARMTRGRQVCQLPFPLDGLGYAYGQKLQSGLQPLMVMAGSMLVFFAAMGAVFVGKLGIPCALGHPVHEHLDSDSTLTWTLIPRPLGH